MPKVIAIDLGASSGRVAAVSLHGSQLEIEELHRFATPNGFQNGSERWLVPELIANIKKGISCAGDAVSAGIDTWGVDFGLLNHRNELIANPIRYRDPSHTVGFAHLQTRLDPVRHFQRIGIQPLPFNTASQLMARKLRRDDELEQAATLAMMPDLLACLLVNGKPTCEQTIASTSEMVALNGGWDEEMLDCIGIPRSLLPDIEPAGQLRGSVNGIEIRTVASHDTASAVLACPAEGENWAFLSSGTWSIIGIETDAPITTEEAAKHGFGNERRYGGTFRFLKNCSGLWLLERTRGGRTPAECIELARNAKPFCARFDPDDPLLINPADMAAAIRTLADAPIEDEAALFRAIFENLAAAYARSIARIETISGREIHTIHLVGGGSQNELLNQMTADAAGKLVLAGPVEATVLGNALVQFEAAGAIQNALTDGRRLIRTLPSRTFEPNDHDRWTEWMNPAK